MLPVQELPMLVSDTRFVMESRIFFASDYASQVVICGNVRGEVKGYGEILFEMSYEPDVLLNASLEEKRIAEVHEWNA